jgi:hypothetical protein
MKIGSFLLGGLVGAAAVVYFNNKSKSMLLSAFSSNNQSVGNMVDKAKDKFSDNKDKSFSNAFDGFSKTNSSTSSAGTNAFKKEDAFSANSGLGKVEEIIKQDPELSGAVQDILAQNNKEEKEAFHTQ